ncbi:GNAT family N-acetyltransferase [Microbulbifer magnicolonia]|uniref:GNAT family N-acetyltransferase n=1 Tax=Microbulbifer magnicolonia TaxID=3109744 RepID=UPI002B417FCB|nr:GNAT family N-acetyltransferase [Microbulbifer sp. GG15]
MESIRLEAARDSQLPTLMSWLADLCQCRQWGGPQFRYPFDAQTFVEDCRWRELPSHALVRGRGELLAFGQYYQRLGRCHLGRLIVSPQHRGIGLGKALVTGLARRGCSELGASECSLFVLQDNATAHGLYRALGFAVAEYPEPSDMLAGCDYMIAPAENFISISI